MSEIPISWPGYQDGPKSGTEKKMPNVSIAIPDRNEVLRAFGDEITVLLSGEDTGGKLAMCLGTTPPQSGPPPHYHEREDEWFYPLEGSVEFLLNGEWQAVEPGTGIFVPRGEVHAFRNAGSEPLKMLIQTSPAGFERFFARCAQEFAADSPDMDRVLEISAEHGIHFVEV